METLEYRKLLTLLDAYIDDAKRIAEEKARREALEQHLKLVHHQIETITARKVQIDKLGISAPVDLAAILNRLDAEKTTLEKQLRREPDAPKVTRMSDADRKITEELYQEVMDIPVDQLEDEERWAQFEIWSIRWRIIADRVGNDIVNSDGFLKMCFARIRERMDAFPDGYRFITALDQEHAGEWPGRLKLQEAKLAKLLEIRRSEEEAGRIAEEALQALVLQVATFRNAQDDSNERMLRHAVRNAAKFEHLREEIAETITELRPKLEGEFGFLWNVTNGEDDPAPASQKLTNKDILSRICRRMFSKRLIGACHGPWDLIYKGFPEHDKGRAKEALELLAKAGILRKKSTLIGFRVSIEPKMMQQVEAAIEGRCTGITSLDLWCLSEETQNP